MRREREGEAEGVIRAIIGVLDLPCLSADIDLLWFGSYLWLLYDLLPPGELLPLLFCPPGDLEDLVEEEYL